MENSIKDEVLSIVPLFTQYTESRMPYTYHHDYLRSTSKIFKNKSRSEVAQLRSDASVDELYALAFLQLIELQHLNEISKLDTDKILKIVSLNKRCLEIYKYIDFDYSIF